jgi:hypothetical protein
MLSHKPAVRSGAALHESLRLIYESVRQRIISNITDGEGLSLSFQHEINAA